MQALGKRVMCECSGTSIDDAIDIFLHTKKPYRKAKKLVTKCHKTCCDKPLQLLFLMVQEKKINKAQIATLLTQTLKA